MIDTTETSSTPDSTTEPKQPEQRNGISIDILSDYARIKYQSGNWINTHISYIKAILNDLVDETKDVGGIDFTLPLNCKKFSISANKDLTIYIWANERTKDVMVREASYKDVHFPNLIIKVSLKYNSSKKVWGLTGFKTYACEKPEYSVNWSAPQPEREPGVYVYSMLNFYAEGGMCVGSNVLPQTFSHNLQGLGIFHSVIVDSAFSFDLPIRGIKSMYSKYSNADTFIQFLEGGKYPFYMLNGHPCNSKEDYAIYVEKGFHK